METPSTPQEDRKRSIDSPTQSPSKLSKPVNLSDELTMSRNPRMQRYLIAVEYIGTRFCGVQSQTNGRTVVGVLEEAFEKFVGKSVSVTCSSRTDAGVHALSNVCHVDVERTSKRKPGEVLEPHEPGVVRKAVNHFLQKEGDISVIDVRCVPADFHARFNAQERTYFYRLLSGPEPISIFERERAWHISEELNVLEMQKACRILVGLHDFSSFRSSGCQANSPIRTLDELRVSEVVSSPYFPPSVESGRSISFKQGPLACSNAKEIEPPAKSSSGQEFGQRIGHHCYIVTARAHSFLYHQVRLLVGVLKCVGTGELTLGDVERILNSKTVTAASPMAPACGLYLGNVKYTISETLNTHSHEILVEG